MNHIIPRHADSTAAAARAPTHSVAFAQFASGTCVDLLAPDFAQVTLRDLASNLARLPRFVGSTRPAPYTVAQHSVFVAQLLAEQQHNIYLQRAGLLHDAHEAICGDIPTPMKLAIGREAVHQVETRLSLALYARFGLGPMLVNHWAVRDADAVALQTERRDLLAASAWPWPESPHQPAAHLTLRPWSESEAYQRFMSHAFALGLR